MKTSQSPYRHFDLPVNMLDAQGDWIPPKEREQAVIEDLSEKPPGTLVARKQEAGLYTAGVFLSLLQLEPEGTDETTKLVAASGYNTAWYNHAMDAHDVMRRRLWLPTLSGESTKHSIVDEGIQQLEDATDTAHLLRISIEQRNATILRYKKQLGRRLGNASLTLASASESNNIANAWDDHDRQYYARRGAMNISKYAQTAKNEIGAHPTMAQFADRYSPTVVHVQNTAPNHVRSALDEAMQLSEEVY